MEPPEDAIFQTVRNHLKCLDLPMEDYKVVFQSMSQAMTDGLSIKSREKSSIKMYPSYVKKIPNGSEKGTFIALDLGGTNYRILLVNLPGGKQQPIIDERTFAIPQTKMLGSGEDLFNYIAVNLYDYLSIHDLLKTEIKLGFTFSFPCEQVGLDKSFLVSWTKGFAATGVEGQNVAQLLQNAINKTGAKVQCVAVVNDTVGTLAACALQDPNSAIGLIIGTGTNAAYVEKTENVQILQKTGAEKFHLPHMIINTEWGAFGEKHELDTFITPFDKSLDSESLHPGQHIYEKMCSGSYLGELVRLILVYFIEQKLLFRGELPASLCRRDSFKTKYITETERDPPHLFYSTQYMLSEDLMVPTFDPIDMKIVRYVCEVISKRAAYLIGTGLAVLIHRINRPLMTIGVDGSLYKFHPKFRERMTDIIDKLKPQGLQFHLRLSEDGSGKGAAAIAAAEQRES